MAIDWVLVNDSWNGKQLGAIGFINDKIAVVVAFHDDKDFNDDGKLTFFEKHLNIFSGKGRAIAEVVSQAYANPEILERDPSIQQWRGRALVNFAGGMIVDGAYEVYFAQGVSAAAGAIAQSITKSSIKSYFIEKSLESLVKQSYDKSLSW